MYRRFLSWRYLLRRPINLIGVTGITVGVGALIMIISIMSGFLEESRQTVRGSLADVVVQPTILPRSDGTFVPREAEPLLEALDADPRVAAASPHLTWGAMVTQGGWDAAQTEHRIKDPDRSDLVFAQLVGVDVAREFQATDLRRALEHESEFGSRVDDVEHPFARPASYDGEEPWAWIVVGEQLAQIHDLHKGSVVNLVTAMPDSLTGKAYPSNRKYLVAGTFRTGENEIDASRIYMDRWELSDFLSDQRQYTQVLVKLVDYAAVRDTIEADLGRELHDLGLLNSARSGEVRTWESYRRSLLGAIENERALMGVMLGLIILVAAFTVFAILMMMVTEKRRDIGILTALGATRRSILSIFLMIGMWNALLGSTLGAILGVLGAWRIDQIERWLSSTFHVQIFDRTVYLFDHIPAQVSPLIVVSTVIGALFFTALFSSIPAWLASRTHPIDALRAE
ncbi:MAG: ABC transporter permease [Planctomycetes bacterium]|nr:ABC transporter permease [Planctomycetota bacterium]